MAYTGGKLHPWFGREPNDRAMRNIVRVGTTHAREAAEAATPVDTGDLKANWSITPAIKVMSYAGAAWRGEWLNDAEYAEYVNFGTGLYGPEHRKYLIVPKKPGGVLHWVDSAGGDVYARAVLHPGSPGNEMLAISANALEASWTRLAAVVMRNWAREVERQNPTARV